MECGKSITTLNLAEVLIHNNYKVLILDFDILNNSLHTILGVNKYPKKISKEINNYNKGNTEKSKIKIKELIIKINDKLDLISALNLLFDSQYKISSSRIKNLLKEIQEFYDYIIIDTSSECFFDYTKSLIEYSDLNIYLLESNLVEIKKAKRWLEIYYNQWEIEKERINLLINKYNRYSVKDSSIKNIFYDYRILGKINYNKKINKLVNGFNKNSNLFLKKEIIKEYIKFLK